MERRCSERPGDRGRAREVSPQELDYRAASVGFENRGVSETRRVVGVGSRSVIDFAYDTDWTGLRNWTGFLAGLASLPSLAAPFGLGFASPLPLHRPPVRFFLYRECYTPGRYIDACLHTRTPTYIYLSESIYPRDEEGFPLVSPAG